MICYLKGSIKSLLIVFDRFYVLVVDHAVKQDFDSSQIAMLGDKNISLENEAFLLFFFIRLLSIFVLFILVLKLRILRVS